MTIRGVVAILEHLKALKHRSICYFGPDTAVSTSQQRLQAFRFLTSQDSSIESSEHLLSHWTPSVEDALACLDKLKQYTAIVAVNDDFAWLIYQAAAIKKIRIPEDVSVVGFGKLPFSDFMRPLLTTVDQHPFDIGASAARRLLLRIADPAERPCKILLPCDLVVRDSSAVARA